MVPAVDEPQFVDLLPTVKAHELEQMHGHEHQAVSAGPAVHDDCPAQLLFTSGTVLQPKGALLSHRNLLSNARAKLNAAPQFQADVRLNILPFAHAYARTCELVDVDTQWFLNCVWLRIGDAFLQWAPVVSQRWSTWFRT